ncbi:hypothetical protein PoB_002261600 [Plakobranchus ocellatus]|uniref:Uncharacterized protein n=1 Tax=Plakobranchus ocellatus TaxID=259542 RepID=A0AAV3Z9Y9_9GAST|nr:hypothetical protein PoB_002261600 [Plakobranchus ocellatus]
MEKKQRKKRPTLQVRSFFGLRIFIVGDSYQPSMQSTKARGNSIPFHKQRISIDLWWTRGMEKIFQPGLSTFLALKDAQNKPARRAWKSRSKTTRDQQTKQPNTSLTKW